MTDQLPPRARAQFDKILQKLVGILDTSSDLTNARSEFMDYDGSVGGQVLESEPQIEHPDHEITKSYITFFKQAKKEGCELRVIETLFSRVKKGRPWTHKTRIVLVSEYKAFRKKITPVAEEIGAALRKLGAEVAPDWYVASFDPAKGRYLVLHGDRVRVQKDPTPELLGLCARVNKAAQDDGLDVTGASWRVSTEEDEDDVDWIVAVMRPWPASS
jgi:hypothetical protein